MQDSQRREGWRPRPRKGSEGSRRQDRRTRGQSRDGFIGTQTAGQRKGDPGAGPRKPCFLVFQVTSREHPVLSPSSFMGQQPKLKGHQLDLRQNFPEQRGLRITGRREGLPSPSALIAQMAWWGEERIRQTGAPPPPANVTSPCPVRSPTRAGITLRDPGHTAVTSLPARA